MGTPFKHLRDAFEARCAGMGILPDPGNGGTIQVPLDGATCVMKSGASGETRILNNAEATNSVASGLPAGTEVSLLLGTHGGGNVVITCQDTIDGSNFTITFNSAGDYVKLRADGGTGWKLINNLGCALS
jgi:hypothetical protein